MPTVRGVPLKRPAFEGEGWKAAATDAKQMCFPLPYPEGVHGVRYQDT